MILQRKGAMGDVLMLTPITREYKLQHPEEQIYVETECPQVFDNNPWVNKADRKISIKDKRINLDGSYEQNMDRHPVDMYAKKVGITTLSDKKLELYPTIEDKELVKELVKETKPYIVVHFGKNWVDVNNEEIEIACNILSDDYTIYAIGKGTKKEYVPTVAKDLTKSNLSLQQLSWLVELADYYIGTDTGPLHIAATTTTPIVALFSFVDPATRCPNRHIDQYVPVYGLCTKQFCARENKYDKFGGVNCKEQYCGRGIKAAQILRAIGA